MSTTEQTNKYRSDKSAFYLNRQDIDALDALARSMGLFIPRGKGAGEWGNVPDVVRVLADAYRRDPGGVLATLQEWQRSATGSDVPA